MELGRANSMRLIYKLCLRCGRLVSGLCCPVCKPHSANGRPLKMTVAELVDHLGARPVPKTERIQ